MSDAATAHSAIPNSFTELGDITRYVMDGNYRANPLSPLTQKAFANYKAAYGTDMGSSTVFSYQAVYTVADALERAGTDDHQAVQEALAKTNITEHILPQGPIVFGEDGQNKNASAPMMQILDGEVKVVWPQEYAQTKPVFPFPS